jgi:N-acetylglucosamine-6-sulfatase
MMDPSKSRRVANSTVPSPPPAQANRGKKGRAKGGGLSPATRLAPWLAWSLVLAAWLGTNSVWAAADSPPPPRRNIVFVLSDDHRHDFIGALPAAPDFLETPHLDRMANQGVLLANAFVSTSLCSPSRASILTGQYMHRHGVVDNQRPVPQGTQFFPQWLQQAGYNTALIG